MQVAQQIKVSSVHITFMQEQQWQVAKEMGFLQRMDTQFHWHNGGYTTFDDFLAELASKKRKNIRRERREAVAADIDIEWLTGSDLTEAHWDAFYRFYMDTGSRKWGSPYLTRRFFSEINDVHGRRHSADHGQARRPLHCRRHQLHRRRYPVWPQLGLH